MLNDSLDKYKVHIRQILICFGFIVVVGIMVLFVCLNLVPKDILKTTERIDDIYYLNYDVSSLDDTEANALIKYGFELFDKTPIYLGPDAINPENAYAGNRLACGNCHLFSGTKPYSGSLIGIIQRFPQFRGRENKIGTIEERINGCFERSMNGKALPLDSKEMKAFVKYLEWLSRYAPDDGNIMGKGFVKIEIPERAVNLEHGKQVFEMQCTVCHGKNGQGVKSLDGYTYEYPPLWGDDSFNNGAGMNRVITAAEFIKGNMPFGTTYDSPILTDEEAYDVAGYINQQQRPIKKALEKDFPDLKKKPVSTPYPPYVDNFSVEQHQLGPFQPIMEYYKKHYDITKTK